MKSSKVAGTVAMAAKARKLVAYAEAADAMGRPDLAAMARASAAAPEVGFMSDSFLAIQRSRIRCADGLEMSAQANSYVYCEPRENEGPYDSVEVGFPSYAVEQLLPWAEEPDSPTSTVYARVPVFVLAWVVGSRGGRADSDADWNSSSMLGSGPDMVPKPDCEEPAKLGAGAGPKKLAALWEQWAQQAVLGSPACERAARFEIWTPKGEAPLLAWSHMLASMSERPPALGVDAYQDWAQAVLERLERVRSAKPAAPRPKL